MPAHTTPLDVAVYYFPHYHVDTRNEQWHGRQWTEWELMKHATPRFPEHRQPIVPAWGYFDEADPQWAAREIDLAADHGITTFLYDWYWYDGQPFLHEALEQGFLRAPNSERLKFALMWANHDWANIFPMRFTNVSELLASGKTNRAQFVVMSDYILDHYFLQPNYLRVDGAPYFSIWDVGMLIAGLGGLTATVDILGQFQEKARQRGFPGLHLNLIDQNLVDLPSEAALTVWSRSVATPFGGAATEALPLDPLHLIAALDIASVTPYNWMQHHQWSSDVGPTMAYADLARSNVRAWDQQSQRLPVPFFPNVMQGWDSTPRTTQSDNFAIRTYPWWPVVVENTPQAFQAALTAARAFLDQHPTYPRILTINAWNEWTEGSYLLPDTHFGMAYLEALRNAVALPRE